MLEIIHISEQILCGYMLFLQGKLENKDSLCQEGLNQIKKYKIKEKQIYNQFSWEEINMIYKQIAEQLESSHIGMKQEELLILFRITDILGNKMFTTIGNQSLKSLNDSNISKDVYKICIDSYQDVAKEINLLGIYLLQEEMQSEVSISKKQKFLSKKMLRIYKKPMLEDICLAQCFQIEKPTLQSQLSIDLYGIEVLKNQKVLEVLNNYTFEFFEMMRVENEINEDTIIEATELLCFIRATLQFLNDLDILSIKKDFVEQSKKYGLIPQVIVMLEQAIDNYFLDKTKYIAISKAKTK